MKDVAMGNPEEQTKLVDHQNNQIITRRPQAQRTWKSVRVLVISVVCLMSSIMFLVLFKKFSSDRLWNRLDFRTFEKGNYTWPPEKQQQKLNGGLLPDGLDEKSCRSRYQSALYRKGIKHLPSFQLISK